MINFNGKSIALVGSAKYLSNFSFGSQIDSHDIVVRINKGIDILNESTFNKFGSRTDILYHCLLEDISDTNGSKFGFIEPIKWRQAGTQLIICLPESDINGICLSNCLSNLVKKESIKKIQNEITLEMMDYNLYNDLSYKIGCKPNTGIAAIYHILCQNPKKLSVYGFSFLLDGWIKEYRDGIQNLPESLENGLTTIESWEEKCLNSKRHIQKNQWEFVKKINENFDNFFPDHYMNKILSMKDFKKENLQNFTM